MLWIVFDVCFCVCGFVSDVFVLVSVCMLSEVLLEECVYESAAYESSVAAASGSSESFELYEMDGDVEVMLMKMYGDDEEIVVMFVV